MVLQLVDAVKISDLHMAWRIPKPDWTLSKWNRWRQLLDAAGLLTKAKSRTVAAAVGGAYAHDGLRD